MTSLLISLTVALSTILNDQDQDSTWSNLSIELWPYLEVSKDQLDTANAKNCQLENELNQLTSKLNAVNQSLAMALARPATSNLLGMAQRKVARVDFSKQLWPSLEKQKKVCWINGEDMWGGGVRFVEITDSVFCISEICFGFPCAI